MTIIATWKNKARGKVVSFFFPCCRLCETRGLREPAFVAASLPSHYGGETDGTWLLRPSLALSWQNERVYGDDVSGSAKLER